MSSSNRHLRNRIFAASCDVCFCPYHYNDIIMGAVASQITSLTIFYSAVYSDADQRKHQKILVNGLCAGNSPVTGEFPAQMANDAENVSIWWRHHVMRMSMTMTEIFLSFFAGYSFASIYKGARIRVIVCIFSSITIPCTFSHIYMSMK